MGASCFRGAAKEEVKKSTSNDEVHTNTDTQKVENQYSDNQKGHGKIRDSPSTPQMLRRFRFSELQVATDHFKDSNLLGEGGFGRVYRGWLDLPNPDSENPEELKSFQVAVKRLNPSGFQGYEEWLMEVLMLERLQHPNLVRLVGYCAELGEALLVYEYLPGGSLDRVLFHEVYGKVLSWDMRMQIAVDAASGLAYLHDNNVIHRDFKAPNILLDENSRGKITDFGLARAGPGNDQTHVSTRVVGTLGYVDPTYMETGQLTLKTDVYAFGVVLLELLTGRRTMGDDGKWSLTDWVKPYLSTRKPDLNLLVDERLGEDYNKKAASKLAILAKHCIHAEPLARPEMGDLVKTLKLIKGPNYDG